MIKLLIISAVIALSSCKTVENTHAQNIIDHYESLECENCDEVD